MSKELVAMVGLPRSGKSTLSMRLSDLLGAPVVNRDAIRRALHGQAYIGASEAMVKPLSLYFIRSLFLTGYDTVIYDETNYSRAARDYIKSPDWETSFLVVPTSPEVCKERAVATQQEYLLQVIDEMVGRYEPCGDDEPHEIVDLGWMNEEFRSQDDQENDDEGRRGTGARLERAEETQTEVGGLGVPDRL